MLKAADQDGSVASEILAPLLLQGMECALGRALPVLLRPAVVTAVVRVADGGADEVVDVEGPRAGGGLPDEGTLHQP